MEKLRRLFPDRYKEPRFVSPIQDPKFRRQYDFPLEFSLIGRTYAEVSDSGSTVSLTQSPLNRANPRNLNDWITAWELTGDARFAQAMYGPGGNLAKKISNTELRAAAERPAES